MSKRFFRTSIGNILGWQVRRLQSKNALTTIAVVGSVGKTSTKRAIAQYLGSSYKVQYQEGNYNDYISVPLVYFGLPIPSLFNPFAWLMTFFNIERQLRRPYPYDVVVLELGTDGPGQIKQFAHYVQADVAVVSAIMPEHMEFFSSLDEVAKEELSVKEFSKQLIVNIDDIPKKYLKGVTYQSYGVSSSATVQAIPSEDYVLSLKHKDVSLKIPTKLIGAHAQKVLAAAYLVGHIGELTVDNPERALAQIGAMPGRMQVLQGKNDVTIIDDTYNASPDAVIAALDTLYGISSSQKIAVIGNMNEMGGFSKAAHERVAKYCNPAELDEVIVLGHEAELFLAPIAKAKGNNVKVFHTPYEIGDYLASAMQAGGVVLLKGSQNGVFLEEAIKPLLEKKAALDTLYGISSSQKIAVIGNMNEMGGFSKAAHERVAKYCNPAELDEVIVLGHEAELFLAPIAKAKGNNKLQATSLD
jgi:UDP-N-acetylmuramoyl-tripeptide--D-alanyl-D-alanine ligase